MTDESSAIGQPYEIVSVRRAEPPPGAEGFNWYRYVIAFEGSNNIHGCRQGGIKAVTRAVEEIVARLNERLSLSFIHPRLPSGSIHDGVRRNIVVRLFSRALGLEQVACRERPSAKTGAFGHCCSS